MIPPMRRGWILAMPSGSKNSTARGWISSARRRPPRRRGAIAADGRIPVSSLPCGGACLEAFLQGFHQVDDIVVFHRRGGDQLFTFFLAADDFAQRGFIAVFEFAGLERTFLLLDDLAGNLDHPLFGLFGGNIVKRL